MDNTQTPVERAEDSTKAQVQGNAPKKEPPRFFKRPDRRKKVNPQREAADFITAAVDHYVNKLGAEIEPSDSNFRTMFRNYAANTGLRGKQKDSVWRAVQQIIREAKSAS
jgi:hypothetical protein